MESVSRQTAPVLEKMVQFVLWLVPTVEKLPHSQYFLLPIRHKFCKYLIAGRYG